MAAWAFLMTDRWADTAKLAEAVVRESEPNPGEEWLYLLGNARRQLKDSENALAAYDRLLLAHPGGKHAEAAAAFRLTSPRPFNHPALPCSRPATNLYQWLS